MNRDIFEAYNIKRKENKGGLLWVPQLCADIMVVAKTRKAK